MNVIWHIQNFFFKTFYFTINYLKLQYVSNRIKYGVWDIVNIKIVPLSFTIIY